MFPCCSSSLIYFCLGNNVEKVHLAHRLFQFFRVEISMEKNCKDLETFPLLSVIPFVDTGMGKEAKGNTELKSSTVVYFTSACVLQILFTLFFCAKTSFTATGT